MNFDLSLYKDKKVFVTGHTGFKGSWLCKILANAGADVTGYSLNPSTTPSLFENCKYQSGHSLSDRRYSRFIKH